MMKTPGDSAKVAWLLFAYRATILPVIQIPVEIFDYPETCFKKYPGDWRGMQTTYYYLTELNDFENFQELDCIYLESYSFSQKTDITE